MGLSVSVNNSAFFAHMSSGGVAPRRLLNSDERMGVFSGSSGPSKVSWPAVFDSELPNFSLSFSLLSLLLLLLLLLIAIVYLYLLCSCIVLFMYIHSFYAFV